MNAIQTSALTMNAIQALAAVTLVALVANVILFVKLRSTDKSLEAALDKCAKLLRDYETLEYKDEKLQQEILRNWLLWRSLKYRQVELTKLDSLVSSLACLFSVIGILLVSNLG
jgi:hypothetical protein